MAERKNFFRKLALPENHKNVAYVSLALRGPNVTYVSLAWKGPNVTYVSLALRGRL